MKCCVNSNSNNHLSFFLGAVLVSLFCLFSPSPTEAKFSDLKLTGKVTGKNFVAGKVRYKNTNVTVVSYKPAGKTKPVTVLVFDKFSFANHLKDPVEKELFQNFEFSRAAFFSVPKGSGVSNVKASNLPAPLVEALGGAKAPVYPLNLQSGVYFAATAQVKPGSIHENLLTSMGVKKTSQVIKGRLSGDFLDITGIVLPSINISWKSLLARINLNFSIPNLKPNFYLPLKFANSKFNISRERDVLGQTTGAVIASLRSDIIMNLGALGKKTYPAVRISGRLDTGITFGSLRGINWPKLFNLPWVSLTDVKLKANVIRKVPLGDPVLKIAMTAKGRVNEAKNIPVEATVEIQGKSLGDPFFRFPRYNIDLSKIPGLRDIPGLSGVKLTDPIISPKAIGGKLTVEKLNINKADVLFFKTNKPAGWNFATRRDNLSAATLIKPLKGTIIEKVRLNKAALIISKPGFKGKVSDLPKKVRAFLKAPLPTDDMALPLASGVNLVGTFRPGDAGNVGKLLTNFGAPKQLVLMGGVTGVFDNKPRSCRMSGDFLKLSMPDLGFFKLPQPKKQPSLFMEYINNQPAIGVEVVETLPIKDGNRTINFNSKLAFTVGTGGASIAMTGTSTKDWPNPFKIKGLTLKKGTSLSVAGGIVGPQVSFKGITQIGSKQVTLGGTLASAGAAIRGSIDKIGLTDVAVLAAEIAKAGGKKVDISGLPVAEFKKVDIAFASPGVSVPDLKISNGGTRMRGNFYFLNPKKSLGRLDVNFDVTGMDIKANLGEIGIGPLVLKKNNLDLAAKASAPPRFAIESQSKILGVTTKVKLNAGAQRLDVVSSQKFGDLFAFGFGASTGDTIDWKKFDITKADLRLSTSLQSDPGKWIRESGSKVVKKAFDSLKPGLNKAAKDLDAAKKKVARLSKDIATMRAKVKKEKEPSINRLKKAEAEVKKLQGTINGLDRQIRTFNGRIKSCRQSKRICVWGKPVRSGCKKRVWGKCVIPRYKWKCQQRRTVPNYPARAACEARNTKPRAEKVVAQGKRAGVVAAKVAASKTVNALRKGLENLPVDLDPRVATLIAAKGVATAALDAAKQTVKGIGNFTDLLTKGVAAVGKKDVFVLEKSAIRGSLNGGLKGKPVLLDMNFKLAGKPYKNRLGFSLTDWKYNAKQFEVIALGAAVKAVVKEAKKAKIVPHVLLDRVNALFLRRQAETNANAVKAVKENGQIETNPADAKKSIGRSIDMDNRIRRIKQEADRKKKIALRKKLQAIIDKKRQAQLASLNPWTRVPGRAVDIGVGANGTAFVIGSEGNSVWKWNPRKKNWDKFGGGLRRISVGPRGRPCGVSKDKTIWCHDGRKWRKMPGAAYDIGVGANGKKWVIGTNKEGGGYGIYRWDEGRNVNRNVKIKGPFGKKVIRKELKKSGGGKWTKIKGSAVRIAVDPRGNAWVVNKQNRIFRYNGRKWIVMPGRARDIGIGAKGHVWVVGTNKVSGGYGVWRWTGKTWKSNPGGLTNLAVDSRGKVWGVNNGKRIYIMK